MVVRVEVVTKDNTLQSAELKADKVNYDIAFMFCMVVRRLDTDGATCTVHRLKSETSLLGDVFEGEPLPHLMKLFSDVM